MIYWNVQKDGSIVKNYEMNVLRNFSSSDHTIEELADRDTCIIKKNRLNFSQILLRV